MYIFELSIDNFRTFNGKTTIEFHEGTNVIIGQNNAGKTTVIKALELLFDSQKSKRLSIDDFNRHTTIAELKANPPKITISAKLKESEGEGEYSDDLVTVSTWLTKLESPYEARITYEYFLPDKELEDYIKSMSRITEDKIEDCWDIIRYNFLRKYTHKVYVGNPEHKNSIDPESINKFAFQFLTAIRDVERDLFTGRNALLKEVIDFFMDYDIKIDEALDKDQRAEQIKSKKKEFTKNAQELIKSLQVRMEAGKEHMLKYVQDTGAGFGGMKPAFDGSILDTELYSALKLIVENETGIKLPAIHNGLGFNNLLYISLLLAKMQKDASGDYLGSNAKVYSILAIEEPEAHLHPNMQYKFLKFLKENQDAEVNQIFITSHSPNITAAVDLEDIIVLQKDQENIRVAYPGKVFSDSPDDQKSKNYVKRFIDVTKADMFFAENLILVEGLAEQLLVPEFAKIIDSENDLAETHTSVINIGGRYFEHFLKLFDTEKSEYAIKKKVACLTDLDPVRKEKNETSWKSCSPLFLHNDIKKYEYKPCSNGTVEARKNNQDSLIRVFTQMENESSTFEYDLILKNITCEKLLTESVSNKDELKSLMTAYKENKSVEKIAELLGKNQYKEEVERSIALIKIQDEQQGKRIKEKIIAGRYMTSINKGEVAQELAQAIFSIEDSEKEKIIPPDYIKEAIQWICQMQ